MKTSKIVSLFNQLFNGQNEEQDAERIELKEALQLIKNKQKELKALLECTENSEERKELQEKISILQAQRSKGIDRLRNPPAPNDDA